MEWCAARRRLRRAVHGCALAKGRSGCEGANHGCDANAPGCRERPRQLAVVAAGRAVAAAAAAAATAGDRGFACFFWDNTRERRAPLDGGSARAPAPLPSDASRSGASGAAGAATGDEGRTTDARTTRRGAFPPARPVRAAAHACASAESGRAWFGARARASNPLRACNGLPLARKMRVATLLCADNAIAARFLRKGRTLRRWSVRTGSRTNRHILSALNLHWKLVHAKLRLPLRQILQVIHGHPAVVNLHKTIRLKEHYFRRRNLFCL